MGERLRWVDCRPSPTSWRTARTRHSRPFRSRGGTESSTPKPPFAVRGDIAAHGRIGLASAMNQSLSAEAPAARHACDTVHLRGKFGCAGAAVNGKTISWRARNETRTHYCLETMECARRFTQLDGVAVGSSLP